MSHTSGPFSDGSHWVFPDGRRILRQVGADDTAVDTVEGTDADGTGRTYSQLVAAYNNSNAALKKSIDELERAKAHPEDYNEEQVLELRAAVSGAYTQTERLESDIESADELQRARSKFKPITAKPGVRAAVTDEPDMYVKEGRSFLTDLYHAEVKNSPDARGRIDKHQRYEVEKRAITSGTLGGIIPPAYLVDLYAKASRNGRVVADQVNNQTLPDVGMSVIVPRLTTGTAAGAQATENTTVTTQDVVESDLTVNVRTIAGYSPVSRQAIERAAYSDQILFEDLIARYWAQLDTQAINGGGGSGTLLGILQTSSIATSTASTATVAGVWPKIADVIQQISTNMGGIGYVATKIFMHPRRWGFFEAALDSQNRPLMVPSGPSFNAMGGGNESGYGYVGQMHGLPVYTDANIPTNLGTNTNEDRIIVVADPVVHLWERSQDPVTLSFEAQAATSLQVQLVCFGYVAFTAGRYPGAAGAVTGAGLVPPTF
jgi:HK97 family phage major capsid protein